MAENGRELLEHELRDIYDAEKKLVRALETMSKKVKDKDLAEGFRRHRDVTQGHAERLGAGSIESNPTSCRPIPKHPEGL